MTTLKISKWARRQSKKGRERHDFKEASQHAGHRRNAYWSRHR